MKNKTEYKKVTINIPMNQYLVLLRIMEEGNYKNLTDVIRRAIQHFIRSQFRRKRKFMTA